MHPQPAYSEEVIASAHRLMKELLALKDQRFVDAAAVRRVADQFNLTDIEQTIYFLRELHGIVRRLPLKIFRDDEDRLRLVSAIQEALDVAVDEEEEELA